MFIRETTSLPSRDFPPIGGEEGIEKTQQGILFLNMYRESVQGFPPPRMPPLVPQREERKIKGETAQERETWKSQDA